MVLLAAVLLRPRFATNIATHIKNCHRSSFYPIQLLCSVHHNTSPPPVMQLRNSSTYNIKSLIFQPPSSTDHGLLSIKIRGFTNDTSPRHRRNEDPDMRVCQSIEELNQMAYDHISIMSPRGMSAYWTLVSKLLNQRNRPSNQLQIMNNNRNTQMQMKQILAYTLKDITTFGYRDLAQTSISFAKIINKVQKRRRLHYGSTEQMLQEVLIGKESKIKQFIFKEIASASVPILREFDARHLSNLIYSYGLAEYVIKFEDDGSTLFDVFAHTAIPNLHTFNGQDLSNMLWSYANVKAPNSQLFEQAGDSIVAINNLHNFYFKPQELSNTVWAFATAEESHPKLFKKLGDYMVRLDNLTDFWPQALSNSLWAYATLNETHPKLFKKVADHIVQLPNLNEFKPQELKDIVWAFATAGESQPELFKKLAGEAIKRQHEFIPQELANFLWSYVTNGEVDKHLFSSLIPSVKANLDKYNARDLSNVAWVYSVANIDAPSVFNNDFINACSRTECEFESEALLQLHQWQLWQDEMKSTISLPESFQKRCYEAFISRVPEPSKLQDDVISSLSSMGLQPREEVLMKSGYRIDAVVEVNGRQVAIEVDGPSHFIGRSRTRTGSTILKHRQVAVLDRIQVVSIPYWEWDKLKKDSKKKMQYLQHLLGV